MRARRDSRLAPSARGASRLQCTPLAPRADGRRRGLTLLEVVTALAIFLIGVTALYQLIQDSSYRALQVDWKAQASLRCQSKLAEVLIGAVDLQTTDYQAFGEDADNAPWMWRVSATEETGGLYRVTVEVKRELSNGELVTADLVQFIVPPTMRGSSLDVFDPPTTDSGMPSSKGASKSGGMGTTPSGGAASPATPAPSTPAPKTPSTPTPITPKGGGGKG